MSKSDKNLNSYGEFFRGISISKKAKGGFYSLVNIDVHSDTGSATCSYAMEKASASLVDALPTSSVTLPDGNSFFANMTNGKIWKVTTAGVVSLVHTNTNGGNFGLGYFGGVLYYASATKLGYISAANAASEATWSTQTDTWQTFTNTNTHPVKMIVQNESLFIPNKNYITAVNSAGAFEANSLDLQSHHSITTFFKDGIGIVACTYVGDYHNEAGLFYWDTYSPSWGPAEDTIKEAGINMVIDGDEIIFIQAGLVGNLYYWTGANAKFYKRLRDGANVVTTGVNPYGSANLNNLPLINTVRGIFSLGRADSELKIAQVIEYVPSSGQGSTPGAIQVVGSQIFPAWNLSTTYGIDKKSANKATGIITTCRADGKIKQLKVSYDSLPTGTSITSRISKDGAAFAAHTLVKDDTDEMVYKSSIDIMPKKYVLAEVTLVPSTTTAPTIDNIELI